MVNKKVFASFAVKDIASVKSFYTETLGLTVEEDTEMGMLTIKTPDGGMIMVYPKPDHEPAVFTVLNLTVDSLEAAVDELTGKGVSFEKYEGFNQDEKGIARSDDPSKGPTIAWCKDPSGNVVALMQDWDALSS